MVAGTAYNVLLAMGAGEMMNQTIRDFIDGIVEIARYAERPDIATDKIIEYLQRTLKDFTMTEMMQLIVLLKGDE